MIGFYNVIKPTGMSSTQVVGKIKRIIQQKRVGHLGTLDSAASGVLPVAVGKATKFFNYFLNKDKVYYAIAEFGVETTTLDSEGEIITNNTKEISKKNIDDIINEFIGEIDQVPPVYSALKIGGVPAYKLARNGVNVKIKQRKTKIYSIECIEEIAKNIFSFRVHCAAGTYIRTLLSDMAKRLGTVANIPVIIREKSGPFEMSNALTLTQIENNITNNIITIEQVFSHLQKVDFNQTDGVKIRNGMILKSNFYGLKNGEEFLGYVDGNLYGLFVVQNELLKCKINVYEGE